MVRENIVQSPVSSYQRLLKWYLIFPWLTLSDIGTYKGKFEQSRKRSSALPYTSVLKLLKKEPSGRQLYFTYTYIGHTDEF